MTNRNRMPLAVTALAALGLTALGLTACSSAASTPQPAAQAKTAATCAQVGGVLADGPDPDADPVGYAEAQVGPLGKIQTQDAALRDAIGKLAGAYQDFFSSNGSTSAKQAVSAASNAINKICPGVTS
jgi:hypothetical protein